MLKSLEFPYPHLHAQLEQGVLTLVIDRAEAKNALNTELYINLRQAICEADQASEVRVLVLRGANTDFSSGNDMKSLLQLPKFPEAGQAGSTPPFMLLKSVAEFSKPCIAAVRGACIGVANTLLLHFDFVYADNSATFQMPFVSLGLSLEGAASLLLVQCAGHHQAAEILLSAKKYDANKALKVGIINEIVNLPYDYASAQAQHLATLPIASLKAAKKLMKHNLDQILKCIDDEAEVVMQRVGSPEMFEAVNAFMQKRKPDFSQFN
ncbi:enoyl-CoA hydratase [Acinetobacter sp. TGL-Y2]|uniref:enoyl-CoA hydratase-related protein n=1 Tax=Acinetobacter sp. TGL-Y2 TaxID=1407071 RepID=UPI0007A67B7C|nr:enoyl-CoA hydratase-related protein [Acinetobacter sp. TGL-Y2]AMW78396.1 enoyl-CoA hydratase [Acinetobacter sp. TGL-Y2]